VSTVLHEVCGRMKSQQAVGRIAKIDDWDRFLGLAGQKTASNPDYKIEPSLAMGCYPNAAPTKPGS
jgi:hypothetical protein